MLIYIASPYTKGDPEANVMRALECAEKVVQKGHYALVPILTHYWQLRFPHPREFWIKQDIELLSRCDCLLRLDGESEGADYEVAIACKLGKPVYFSVDELSPPYLPCDY